MDKSLSGLHAGLIATGPMTVSMVVMQSMLKEREKSPFPPATISYQLARRAGAHLRLSPQTLLTNSAHLAYGSIAGLIYSQSLGRKKNINPILRGVLFGSTFWAANYFLLLPAMGVRASGYKMTLKRNAMMCFSHLVWGATLGYLEAQFEKEGFDDLAGSNKASNAE